jgi:hypothetical protein
LNTDHGIVFVAKLMEIRIVYPNILGELELANNLAQITKAAIPRSTPSPSAPSGKGGPYAAQRRIILRR